MTQSELSIKTIQLLGVDAINHAKSGHPGMVLGAAPMMYALFHDHLRATPKLSNWKNRDRFILAAGHGSMLIYSMLHLTGYKVSIEDIKLFRQVGSNTPGHPEYGRTDGIDSTSGPLGQGIAHAVGMAIAEVHLAARFNRPNFPIVDHYTYALCGDGDLQEGVTQEAVSLAGQLKLNKLIVLFDSNNVTLDGPLAQSFNEDVPQRFRALQWNVIELCEGEDPVVVSKAIQNAKSSDKPTLIVCPTVIGRGSVNEGSSKTHGAPLGDADTAQLKAKWGWTAAPFTVESSVYEDFAGSFGKRGSRALSAWKRLFAAYQETYPELAAQYLAFHAPIATESLTFPEFPVGTKVSTRKASHMIINQLAPQLPQLFGGSADLSKSVMTTMEGLPDFSSSNYAARNVNFGIREFAMSAAQTGMLLHGGVRPYVGAFMVFADYLKPSIRTAAIMEQPGIYLLSHDSIAVGEDGPTHQPIEQLTMLRTIPNTVLHRPANGLEANHAWRMALESHDAPQMIALSRQDLVVDAQVDYATYQQGAYVVSEATTNVNYIVIATGSEVNLAVQAKALLGDLGKSVRIVSMPVMSQFIKQSKRYQKSILSLRRNKIIALELGHGGLWYRFADHVIAMETFGESGPMNKVMEHFHFTPSDIAAKLRKIIQ